MRPLQLGLFFLTVLLVFLSQMSSPSSSSPPSSLAQRPNRQIRQARNNANVPPYRQIAPRRLPDTTALRDIGNAPATRLDGGPEPQRTAHRDADHERQLALQETPSRRAAAFPQPAFAGVGTPPDSQQAPLPPTKRQLAQRARQQAQIERQAAAAAAADPQAPLDNRTAAQRLRREREREDREHREREERDRLEREERDRLDREELENRERERRPPRQLLTPPATRPQERVPPGPPNNLNPPQRPPSPIFAPQPPQAHPAPARQRQRQRALPPARRPYQEPPARHDLGRMDIKCSHCGEPPIWDVL
ncbi:hypothetical protein B0H10DRAFT_1974817 [Mycena sp. CBHHK59/15]|nr:hypothetical protein B0H10DRAFT_1974817 [Mycena sp. CBHHK59/15]